jgi:hypothetical protein
METNATGFPTEAHRIDHRLGFEHTHREIPLVPAFDVPKQIPHAMRWRCDEKLIACFHAAWLKTHGSSGREEERKNVCQQM